MDSISFMDRDAYHRYYCSDNNSCSLMDEDTGQNQSAHPCSRFCYQMPTNTDLGPAFNACATSMTEDDRLLDLDQISSLLRYTGQLQRDPNSLSSSSRSSSTSKSRSRSPYNNSPAVKMEFNEDVLVMDGILLNESSRDSRFNRSFMLDSSSTATCGKHYGGGIHKHPYVYRTRKKLQQMHPFLLFGEQPIPTVAPPSEVPSPSVKRMTDSALDTKKAKPTVEKKSDGGVTGVSKSPCRRKLAEVTSEIEPLVLLEEEEKEKGNKRVYVENVPTISGRLPIFVEICHS